MYKSIIASLILVGGALGAAAQNTDNPKFAIKLKGDFGLTDAFSTEYSFASTESSSSFNNYGLEFSWAFWQKGNNSLELGAGFYMGEAQFKTGVDAVSFSYAAGPEADMDGNSYIRYTDMSPMKQTLKMTRMSVPVYVQYNYRFHPRWTAFAKAGVQIGFGGSVWAKSLTGSVDSYGVYPEYGDLVMDDEWLNDFGVRTLAKGNVTKGKKAKADIAGLVGAGIRFKIIDQLHLSVGVNYQAGFSDMLKGDGLRIADGQTTAADAPVSYTVADGLRCKPLTDGLTKCRLNRLGLDVGLELRF